MGYLYLIKEGQKFRAGGWVRSLYAEGGTVTVTFHAYPFMATFRDIDAFTIEEGDPHGQHADTYRDRCGD